MSNNNQGFTLMELMISVAIIAILLAIAMPNYQRSVVRGNRAAVQAEMMQIAALMEQYKARQLTYTGADFRGLGRSATVGATTIDFPRTGTATYSLALSPTPLATTWTLTATPLNRQLSANDGQLAINSFGQQCWSPGNSSGCSTSANLADTTLAWSVAR